VLFNAIRPHAEQEITPGSERTQPQAICRAADRAHHCGRGRLGATDRLRTSNCIRIQWCMAVAAQCHDTRASSMQPVPKAVSAQAPRCWPEEI
jgi:hypothetical protein